MIYDEILLEHNTHPEHSGELSGKDVKKCKLFNASCGDKLEISLKIQGGKIIDGSFSGVGCAISKASADIMLGEMIGKSLKEAKELAKKFFEQFDADETAETPELGEANALLEVRRMPARAKCAKLAWTLFES